MPSVAANGAGGDFTVHVTSIRVLGALTQMPLHSLNMEQMSQAGPPALDISNAKCTLTTPVRCTNETNGPPVVGVACRL